MDPAIIEMTRGTVPSKMIQPKTEMVPTMIVSTPISILLNHSIEATLGAGSLAWWSGLAASPECCALPESW